MPLLMCPNDNSAMNTVERSGVHFDMCPTCRGVWLDRGELEKLMETARSEGAAQAPGQGGVAYRPASYPPSAVGGHSAERGEWGERGERGERGEWGERGERGERGHYGHKRRSIFDIFD